MEYVILFFVLLLLEMVYFKIADNFNIIDKPNLRSSHAKVTLRGGGIIFPMGMIIFCLVYGLHYPLFMIGLLLVSIVSFIDDIHSVSNKKRLLFQFTSVILMLAELNISYYYSWWIIIFSTILFVGILNAYNFMDGINGITGGYSLVILISLWYTNRIIGFISSDLLIVCIITTVVFNFFNFRTKAKCFAGDVGSISIAFIILFILGRLILKTGNLAYFLYLSVYGVDSVLTIIHRLLLKENLGKAHRKHLYQLMANELQIPHVVVSLIYMLIQALISSGLILCMRYSWIYSSAVIFLLVCSYIHFMRKYYHLHVEYLQKAHE